jgi:Uma2 family endonuclease
MPTLPEEVGITIAPDWVCEVLSPTTSRLDRLRKMPIYARERIEHCWLVDPLARTLEVFRFHDGRFEVTSTHGGVERIRLAPFDAIELDLARWWASD